MREIEVCVINRLKRTANAYVEVSVLPPIRLAGITTRPLYRLNPGPRGGRSTFIYCGDVGVTVRGRRGGAHSTSGLQAGDLVKIVRSGGHTRILAEALRLGGNRVGIRNALDVPRLLTVDWLIDDRVVVTAGNLNQGSIASAKFDDVLWFSIAGDFHSSRPVPYAIPPDISRLTVEWDRIGGFGGRDHLRFEPA